MSVTYENILYEKRPPIAWITLNRPERLNAISKKMDDEIMDAVNRANADDAVRVIIMKGAGDRAFSAGADIKDPENFGVTPAMASKQLMKTIDWALQVQNTGKPMIAAVRGYCLGGGLEYAMVCDMIISGESGKFGQPEINLAIIPGGGGTQRLPRLVGRSKAMELTLTGDRIDSKEAERIGLVNRVVPDQDVERVAEEIAMKIAEKSPVAAKAVKMAVAASFDSDLRTGLTTEAGLYAMCMTTEDSQEAATAFAEKRKPSFKGR